MLTGAIWVFAPSVQVDGVDRDDHLVGAQALLHLGRHRLGGREHHEGGDAVG